MYNNSYTLKMDIQEFYRRYGKNTTTNFQLVKYAKELKVPNFHVCMRDEIKHTSTCTLPLNVITNIHTSSQHGVHWSAIHMTKERAYFFDSFALPPTKEIIDFLPKNIERLRNTFEVQSFDESNCGQLSLFVLYKLNRGEAFQDIILSLFKKDDT